jgi:predicted dehydrogenase
MKRTKIGIIGCGHISGIYFQNLTQTFVNTEVYACADVVAERAKEAADKYGICKVLTTEELLQDPAVEIVVNLTIPKVHFDVCKSALLAGKHVYVEKPLSLTLEQGRELLRLANERNLMIGCAPDTFLGGGLQTCRKLIDDGFIGTPIGGTAFLVNHGHEGWHPDPEFYYQAGGGPMFDMGPYYLTALVSLLGEADTVCGMTKISFPERTITSAKKFGQVVKVEVPTHIAGTIQFKNGAIINMITSFDVWGSNLPRIEIYGTLGTLLVPDPNTFGGSVYLKMAHGTEFKEIPLTHIYQENSRGIGVADMAHCLQNGGVNRASGELANHVLELMHAFHISADSQTYYKLTSTCSQPTPLPLNLVKGYVK